jgi:RNA polymerase sigma factor (sigma-70 family)
MAHGQSDNVLEYIRKLVAGETTGRLPDRELLDRFIQYRDEAAFTGLVQRYGPMVLNVCRRVLGHIDEAEDAWQATFLVLACKAASIRKKDSLGSWLHRVAFHVAANLKREVVRRRAHEQHAVAMPEVAPADITWREVQSVIDEELQRLPKRFQAPLILCYLEGKTRDGAARELGWSLGTLRGRLEHGRELLRARLTRRGLTLSAALLASLLVEHVGAAALPTKLVVRIVKAAALVAAGQTATTTIISNKVAELMKGGLKAMWITKLKIDAVIGLAVALAGIGAGLLAEGILGAQTAASSTAPVEPTLANAAKLIALDEPPAVAGSSLDSSLSSNRTPGGLHLFNSRPRASVSARERNSCPKPSKAGFSPSAAPKNGKA